MYFENLTKQYELSKTLRFNLIPQGKTLENIKNDNIIEADKFRKENAVVVKKLFDKVHNEVINSTLEKGNILGDIGYVADLYFKPSKNIEERQMLDEAFSALRECISKALKEHKLYKELSGTKIFKYAAKDTALTEEEYNILQSFNGFTSYFTNYNDVRATLYSDEAITGSVANRAVNDNLPRFFDNIRVFSLLDGQLSDIPDINDYFTVGMYEQFLSQKGIDAYNEMIGKLNIRINLINNSNKKNNINKKFPKLKELYKQLLSDKKTLFIDMIESDEEAIERLHNFEEEFMPFVSGEAFNSFYNDLYASGGTGVYVKNDVSLTSLSVMIFSKWNEINDMLIDRYDSSYTGKKKKYEDKYIEERKKQLDKYKSYDLASVQALADDKNINILNCYVDKINEDISNIKTSRKLLDNVLYVEHIREKKLAKNLKAVDAIKTYLDYIKTLERDLKLLSGTGDEDNRDIFVYNSLELILSNVTKVDSIYNLMRNYLTKKPFSEEKIKLNFNTPCLLAGWDINKESDYCGIMLLKDDNYYLGILASGCRNAFKNLKACESSEPYYEKMVLKQIPSSAKYLSSKQIYPQNPPEEIVRILEKKKKDSKSLDKTEISTLIDYLQNDFLKNYSMLIDENGENYFNFSFKKPEEYNTLNEFFIDVDCQAYSVKTKKIPEEYINKLVDEGKLYLFKIYSKDFSEYSKGNLNLHTIYFKMLFDERNLKNPVYQINGGAEVFYRPASIDSQDMIVHKAHQPVQNKNINNEKKESVFDYDIIKNKRYTKDQFLLHIPVTMNFGAGKIYNYNNIVNKCISADPDVCVIGINRGERNLLYVSVVNKSGRILEQKSLNVINNTDYYSLLLDRENERNNARKDWKNITDIKNLKEGYLSLAVNEIVKLIFKYNAVVVLEDLNMAFKNSRQKIERNIYQKFEKMLITKFNYLVVDKSREQTEALNTGGALNALQLTSQFESFNRIGKQTGCIYYVPARYIGRTDTTSGFVNLLSNLRYENVTKSQEFFNKFDVCYNSQADEFEFQFDYNDFTDKAKGTKTDWTLSSYGDRIVKFKNESTGSWDEEVVDITSELKSLFDEYGIDYISGNNFINDIIKLENRDFFLRLTKLFNLMLQMKNTSLDKTTDYFISPVKNRQGSFYDTRKHNNTLPDCADANDAYNIALKGLWAIDKVRSSEDRVNLVMSDKEWLTYIQSNLI